MLPVIPSSAALIVELPFAAAVARPCDPDALEMLATEVVPDVQFTAVVRFWVVVVRVRAGGGELVGVSDLDQWIGRRDCERLEHGRADGERRRARDPVERGTDRGRALPDTRRQATATRALEMVATEVALEAQVTWPVRFCVELSVKVPMAVN